MPIDNTSSPLVHVIDDDIAVLDSMSLLLQSVGLENRRYQNAPEFLQAYESEQFDRVTGCILLDVRMPIMSGIECQHILNQKGCVLPIIFITGHGDVPMAVEAMKNGAVEFIQKPVREQTLIEAVQKALQMNSKNTEKYLKQKATKHKIASLTEREKQILDALVDGKANKVIAAQLHLSSRTVEIHRANVMEKMGATSLAHLIKMVLDDDR